MNTRFLALVVVYGSDPFSTSSLQTLLANDFDRQRLRILVWDNSPTPSVNEEDLHRDRVLYRATPENLGLSSIYNQVISKDLDSEEHLILLDQDTVLPINFLKTADEAIGQHPDIDLFLPMIRANGYWVSPLDYCLGWGRYWAVPRYGRMKSAGVCAINSGMVISAKYLLGRSVYDEKLRFYGTDTQFMLDYVDHRDELVVLDVQLDHDLSFFSDSLEQRARKFIVMRAANKQIYAQRSLAKRFGSAAIMMVVSLVYAWRYRSCSFLKHKP